MIIDVMMMGTDRTDKEVLPQNPETGNRNRNIQKLATVPIGRPKS